MAKPTFKTIPITSLQLDLTNPRYGKQSSQRQALQQLLKDSRAKVLKLAGDIVENGMNPLKRVMVEPARDGMYTALEGNRRLAALKLLAQPELRETLDLSEPTRRRLKALTLEAGDSLPSVVDCVIMDRSSGEHWIWLEHTGFNEGAGTVDWDAGAVGRFQGGSPELQAIELLKPHLDADSVDDLRTGQTTTLRRLLETPEARKHLGVEISGSTLTLEPGNKLALARLLAVSQDILSGKISSRRGLMHREDRIKYAKEVAGRDLSPIGSPATSTAGTGRTKAGRRRPVERTKLIPGKCVLSIDNARLNRIYHELQDLLVAKFRNAVAVLLRVFVELSTDEYGKRHGISFKLTNPKAPRDKEISLHQKLTLVADHLEKTGRCTKPELAGIKKAISGGRGVLAIEDLHAYIHNQNMAPSPSELLTGWDNIELFVQGLWKK